MDIKLHKITVKDVVTGYSDNAEEGVYGYDGKLDIRPKYQREFVYTGKQRDSVLDTVIKGFPLNVMYWVKTDQGNFEVLDGQQRTISIAQYVNSDFSIYVNGRNAMFHNLTDEEQNMILDYELMIYFCEGTDKEKLDWFKTINIAGEQLFDQELRNAVYTGPWLSDAKLKFSKPGCVAYLLANDGGVMLKGKKRNRQEYLETAISWINNGNIDGYMQVHQLEDNANELWEYFQNAIGWARKTFPNYREEMGYVNWGELYNNHKDKKLDSGELEERISKLMQDDDVTKPSGVYYYVLNGKEKYLSIRAFDDKLKRQVYERQKGVCVHCKAKFDFSEMEADHITPWHEGGKTIVKNCQMLCRDCNRTKSGK